MFENTAVYFPNNVVNLLALRVNALNQVGDVNKIDVFKRPLRPTDPKLSAGIFASQWIPNDDSYEMGGSTGGFRQEPTLSQYVISIQAMNTDMDEYRGLAVSSAFAKTLRDMLLRDTTTGVALSALRVTGADGLTEGLKRRWVRTQRYLSNEIQGSFVYLATLELTVETETS